jgi:mannose-1-phosphate guanylyltransferase / mannose-6-phosphate isomerase
MKDVTIVPAIMAGGSGTRLWPLSRQAHPKQFVSLTAGHSFFQQALLRVQGPDFAPPIVLGHVEHRFLLAEHARSAGVSPVDIVLEPLLRDTAPAACVAALRADATARDALVLLTPSDHLIPDAAAFRRAVLRGARAAREGAVVVFGVAPTSPHEGFGYIEVGSGASQGQAARVVRFVEKPNRAAAETYIASGRYLWNAGIFLFRADTMIDHFARHAPEVLAAARASLAAAQRDLDFTRLDAACYADSPRISLDFAVIEKCDTLACVPLETAWNDCGTWASVADILPRDADRNVTHGDAVDLGSRDCVTFNTGGPCVVTLGLENIATIVTEDAILVAHRDRLAGMKAVVDRLSQLGRTEAKAHRRVHRPWGWFDSLSEGPGYLVKRLTLKPGAKLSLQSHRHRAEHWVVVSGTIQVTCDGRVFDLGENQSTYIETNAKHRIANTGSQPAILIEVQSGSYLGEDDIQRYEDVYGRADAS